MLIIHRRYLRLSIPLASICISAFTLLITYCYPRVKRYYHNRKRHFNAPLLLPSDDSSTSGYETLDDTDTEDGDEDASKSGLIDLLPQHTKITVIYDKPAFWRLRVLAEIALLLGQIALTIFTLIKCRSISVVGNIQWVYLLILALVRLRRAKSPCGLWAHSCVIYIFSWPISLALLRSAIIGDSTLLRHIQIANFCLLTGLCAIFVTCRPGNTPVTLVSTDDHEPSRVRAQQQSANK
jgi:hypothetical protein